MPRRSMYSDRFLSCFRARRAGGVVGLLALILLAATSRPASAQLSSLPSNDFIEGLNERGLSELLIYYVQKYPPKDPLAAAIVVVTAEIARYGNENLDADQRKQAYANACDAYRKLISACPPGVDKFEWEVRRPRWATDFTELLFRSLADTQMAEEFVEFGVPTKAQQELFFNVSTEACRMMETAFNSWFFLEGQISQRQDFESVFVNTGRWDRMRQYGHVNIPYYHAQAAIYAAMQDDDGPFFQAQKAEAAKTNAPSDAVSIRNTMLARAQRDLESLLTSDEVARFNIAGQINGFLGRIKILQGQYAPALEALDKTISSDAPEMVTTTARLAKVVALEKSGKIAEAQTFLAQTGESEIVHRNPLLMILVADREHLILRRLADAEADPNKKITLVAASYEPYVKLLASPALKEINAQLPEQIKDYLFTRFAERIGPTENLDNLPPMPVLAVGVKAMQKGQAELEADPNAAHASLDRAVAVLGGLLKRSTLSPATQAEAQYNLGVSYYFLKQPFDASKIFVQLAEDHPNLPLGYNGIGYGLQLAQEVLKDNAEDVTAHNLVERAFKALFDKYPTTPTAAEQRYPWAAYLREHKRYEEAAEAYLKVAPTHAAYAESRYERLFCLHEIWRSASPETRAQKAELMLKAADEYLAVADQAIASSDAERASLLRRYKGDAIVMRCDGYVETLARYGDALNQLTGFENQYKDYPNLISDALRLRIRVLQRQQKWAEAKNQIDQLLKQFPNQAGAVTLGVIDSLFTEVETLRADTRPAAKDEATNLAKIAADLADQLLAWAKTQPEYRDQILPFELMAAKALFYAGQYAQSVARYEPLLAANTNNADVVNGLAEACFGAQAADPAQRDQLRKRAAELYGRLINELPDHTSRRYWNAWARALTIRDLQLRDQDPNKRDSDIALRVRRLEAQDPNLGGEPFKSILRGLRNRHSS